MTTIAGASLGALVAPDVAASEKPTYPSGTALVRRAGLENSMLGLGIASGAIGLAIAGAALLSKAPAGAIASRLAVKPFLIAGAFAGVGALLGTSPLWIPPRSRDAKAMGIPSEAAALIAAAGFSNVEVVKTIDGTWAVVDRPVRRSGGGNSGGGSYHNDNDYYNPPSYNPPPAYDPPSYDPPSYDPPSYGGNSTSNGNPDFE